MAAQPRHRLLTIRALLHQTQHGASNGVLARHLLHAQQLRGDGVATQRGDMRKAIVAADHRQHLRAQDIAYCQCPVAGVAQRRVLDPIREKAADLKELREWDDAAKMADLRIAVVADMEDATGSLHHERVVVTRSR